MEPKQLSELPLVFQIIAGFGLFFGTFMLAIGGWLWKTIKPKLPSALQVSETPVKEAPISSLQVLDHQTFDRLSSSIRELIDFLKTKDDDTDRELQRGFDNLDKSTHDVLREVERVTKAVERVEHVLDKRTLL